MSAFCCKCQICANSEWNRPANSSSALAQPPIVSSIVSLPCTTSAAVEVLLQTPVCLLAILSLSVIMLLLRLASAGGVAGGDPPSLMPPRRGPHGSGPLYASSLFGVASEADGTDAGVASGAAAVETLPPAGEAPDDR